MNSDRDVMNERACKGGIDYSAALEDKRIKVRHEKGCVKVDR